MFKQNNKLMIVLSVVAFLIVASVFYFSRSSEKSSSGAKNKVPAAPVALSGVPASEAGLSAADAKAYTELATWVDVKVSNQPALSKNPATVKLPTGWTAREDYLVTVVPSTLPAEVRNFRAVIMRPPRTTSVSREDAIYEVPISTHTYFKDRCKAVNGKTVCYGGKNLAVKQVFDLMFYFNK